MRNHRVVFGPEPTLLLAVGVVTLNVWVEDLRRLWIGFLLGSRRNPRLNSRTALLSTLQRRPQQTAPHDSGPMWVASHSPHLAGANPYTGGNS